MLLYQELWIYVFHHKYRLAFCVKFGIAVHEWKHEMQVKQIVAVQ